MGKTKQPYPVVCKMAIIFGPDPVDDPAVVAEGRCGGWRRAWKAGNAGRRGGEGGARVLR